MARGTLTPLVFEEINLEMNVNIHRNTLSFAFPTFFANDTIVAKVYPKDNHDCDGVYFSKFQIWEEIDVEKLSLGVEPKVVNLRKVLES